ncbi:ribosomal-processing cysteine protease Prp [Candidatus Phytoplasma luffae]|uniref:Ribosomal processing cysteine protease Prp n=1 Tax=Loofah witches'-broom phytoplasma TaxID=35773 RepID=A0A975FLH9_LOWBP|nr:ribosomal-processing cysteine protease Prp [Candidatus Phytoplasma luffae]QTX03181.1 ribosomal-processing cysteine protease Prp [Candidatus Phytoplasma luffae]
MIKYSFVKIENKIEKVEIRGHALYSFKGNDIVCASVSSVIIFILNAIEIFELKTKITFDLKEGYFFLKILKFDDIINKLLSNLEYTLKNLNKTYPKNLKEI